MVKIDNLLSEKDRGIIVQMLNDCYSITRDKMRPKDLVSRKLQFILILSILFNTPKNKYISRSELKDEFIFLLQKSEALFNPLYVIKEDKSDKSERLKVILNKYGDLILDDNNNSYLINRQKKWIHRFKQSNKSYYQITQEGIDFIYILKILNPYFKEMSGYNIHPKEI